jgi:hypothetical protein
MNRYEILVITGDNVKTFKVFAGSFEALNGFYRFWYKYETVACFPINFTIITNIEKIEEDYE